jgi:hypothetical protein
MPDYSKGQIYTIRFFDNDKLIYIGSTTQNLAVRFGGHKRDDTTSLFQYIQENYNGDFKCCYVELLEKCECNNKQELNKREGEIIRKYKEDTYYIVINMRIAGRIYKEWYEDNKETLLLNNKYYYQENKEKIAKKAIEYKERNKETISKYQKEYREANKDYAKEYQKEYQEKHRELLAQKAKERYEKKVNFQ